MLEEAYASPAGADGAGDKEAHAEDGVGEFVECGDGTSEEGFVAEEGEGAEDEGEEFGDGGEGVKEESDVGSEAGCVVGMKQGAGKVFDGGVGGGCYGFNGEDCAR